jgi:hypothetical protein
MVGLRLLDLRDESQVPSGCELHDSFEPCYGCYGELHIRGDEGSPYSHPGPLTRHRFLFHERIRLRNFSILSSLFTILIDNNTQR